MLLSFIPAVAWPVILAGRCGCYFKSLVLIYQNNVSLFVMADSLYTKSERFRDFFDVLCEALSSPSSFLRHQLPI